MKDFKSFGIAPRSKGFVGDKISIDKLLNKEIIVEAYKVENSKFEGKGRCLHMQVVVGETRHVVFGGYTALIDVIERVAENDFPFTTTIVKENKRYEFT